MKINLVCTSDGFKVADDTDYEKKRKLKKGVVYQCSIQEYRNYKFLKLYFSLINCAWEYLTEAQRAFFKEDSEVFRKCVEVAAGHYELCYSVARKEWVEVPKSIAFDKLNESDFSSLYERVKDVLYNTFITNINKEEFEQQLRFF